MVNLKDKQRRVGHSPQIPFPMLESRGVDHPYPPSLPPSLQDSIAPPLQPAIRPHNGERSADNRRWEKKKATGILKISSFSKDLSERKVRWHFTASANCVNKQLLQGKTPIAYRVFESRKG